MRLRLAAMTALALVLCASPVLANDISNWSTTDANNNATPPNGWPSGTMLPSQVEPTGRSMMGAIARWYALMGGANSAGIANTAAVRSATTANYPNGFFRLTDGAAGAPPLRYVVDTGACTFDDGGSCIAASGGGHFIAQFPGNIADIREFGVVGDNTTDNSVALQNAFNWAAANNGTLYIPGKTFYSASGMSTVIPANSTLTVVGPGKLRFGAAAANGLYFSVTGPYATPQLHDFTLQASGAMATAAAIYLHQNTAVTGSVQFANTTNIDNVTMVGSDGVGNTNYWGYGIYDDSVSNVSMDSDNYYGPASLNGDAIHLAGGGAANRTGIVYNISKFNAYALGNGIYYGSYVQGVTVTQSNFTACQNGAFIASATATDQLTISDSQFACTKTSIDDTAGMLDLIVHHNLFIPQNAGANTNIIFEQNPIGFEFTDNVINGQNITDGFTYTAVGIAAGSASSTGVIRGNVIRNISDGIIFGANTVQGLRVADNTMLNVTIPYATVPSPTLLTNSISNPKPSFVAITNVGATGLSPDWVQLTVTSSVGFYTGEWACVMGTSGGSDPQANICTTISVTDATHIVLQGVLSDGSFYSSGGFIAAIP